MLQIQYSLNFVVAAIAEHEHWHSAISDVVVRLVFDDCIPAGFLVPRGYHMAQCPSEDLHLRISMPIRLEDLVGRWRDAPGQRLDVQVVIGLAAAQHNSGDDSLQWLRSQDKSADQAGSEIRPVVASPGGKLARTFVSGVDVFSEP